MFNKRKWVATASKYKGVTFVPRATVALLSVGKPFYKVLAGGVGSRHAGEAENDGQHTDLSELAGAERSVAPCGSKTERQCALAGVATGPANFFRRLSRFFATARPSHLLGMDSSHLSQILARKIWRTVL